MSKQIVLFLSLLLISFSGISQVFKPVKWTFSTEKINENEYFLVFQATMDDEWTVYSQYTSDDGPVPTEITIENSNNLEVIGDAIEEGHKKEGFDKLFETNVIKFLSDEPYIIKQKVKISENATASGYLTFMTCDDERCLPPTDVDFSFTISSEKDEKEEIPLPDKITEETTQAQEIEVTVQNETDADSESAFGTIILSGTEENTSTQLEDKEDNPGVLQPVSWLTTSEKLSDTEYLVSYTASIDDGWTVYSQHTSDDGPVPTEIVYETIDDVEISGDANEKGHKKSGLDKYFGVEVIKYISDQPFTISQKIKITGDNPRLSGYLTYMACDDERCLPPTDVDFSFNFGENSSGEIIVSPGAKINGDVIDQLIPSIASTYKNPISQCEEKAEESTSYFWTFIFGVLGGFVALLTPCVFPMIPITVSFFTKDTKRKGWVNGAIYGASIIGIYVIIGLLITILLGPEALNRLSTNWIANTAFFLIFVAFAFSFFGFFEITLPSSWSTKSDQMADKGGLIGIFFMAFTLALVSFSCTGPIIGSALVQASTKGEYMGPFLVMLGFSTALALPFGLFAAFPAWLNSLPRSGSWMNTVKVVLGFLELALALKFLSVADMTNHWGFLKYELFMGLWVIVFLGMAAYLFGFIKFPHDSPIKKLSIPRMSFAVLALATSLYLVTGFFVQEDTNSYNALPIMSGLAPPTNYNYFLPSDALNQEIKDKYPSYTKCANNINCYKDYYDGLAYANEVNKPILLDFTGYGCVNCRKTEEHIWVNESIRKKLNDDFVLISLYGDDDEKLDKTLISKHTGTKIRNIGRKWADFQIVNFQQNSQPLYIMMTPQEEVIASPRPYKEGVDEYNAFLECGLQSFNRLEEGE